MRSSLRCGGRFAARSTSPGRGRSARRGCALADKQSLPLAPPLFGVALAAARRLGAGDLSEDFRRLLRYGRAVDITASSRRSVRPRFSTPAAVKDWAGTLSGRRLAPRIRQAVTG